MIVVTGTAPRCGTSAMMRELIKEYKPHSYAQDFPDYVAREKNPEGFWDIRKERLFGDDPIPYEEDSVIKLWAPQFHRVEVQDIKLLIVMQRANFLHQIESMRSCAIAEGFLNVEPSHLSMMFKSQKTGIEDTFSETPQIRIMMETLREDPDSVISSIKEII